MADVTISQLIESSAPSPNDIIEISQLSTTVTISASTISAQASDNSLNDSANGFVAAGFASGDHVKVVGFTGDTANNIFTGEITDLAAGKMTFGGSDGDVIVDDAAGETVTISKWVTRRASYGGGGQELGSLYAGIDSRTAYAAEFGGDEGYDEEFDGVGVSVDTLPVDWIWVNKDAAVYREGFGQGRIDYGGGGDTTNIHAVVRPFEADAYDAIAHLLGSTQGAACYTGGLCLYNSSNGDFIFFGLFQPAANSAAEFYVSHFSDADTQSSTLSGAAVELYPAVGEHSYYRVKKTSDTAYQFQISPDGGCWFNVGGSLDLSATIGVPDHIGFCLNSPNPSHVGCEWIRIRDIT